LDARDNRGHDEEPQSTNKEFETSKEAPQFVNEELQSRALDRADADLRKLKH
jgi:hypothetical protein